VAFFKLKQVLNDGCEESPFYTKRFVLKWWFHPQPPFYTKQLWCKTVVLPKNRRFRVILLP